MSIVYTCNTYFVMHQSLLFIQECLVNVLIQYKRTTPGVSGPCSHTIQAYDSWSVWSMFSYNTSVRLVECLVNVLIQYKRMTRMRRENPFTIHPQLYATIMNTCQYLSSGILKQILINKMMYNTMKMFLERKLYPNYTETTKTTDNIQQVTPCIYKQAKHI